MMNTKFVLASLLVVALVLGQSLQTTMAGSSKLDIFMLVL